MTTWQIQAKVKTGYHWEPISVERMHREPGQPFAGRQFEYNDLSLAVQALKQYLELERTLPHLIVDLATGGRPLLSVYDVRFAAVTHLADASRFPELAEFFPKAERPAPEDPPL